MHAPHRQNSFPFSEEVHNLMWYVYMKTVISLKCPWCQAWAAVWVQTRNGTIPWKLHGNIHPLLFFLLPGKTRPPFSPSLWYIPRCWRKGGSVLSKKQTWFSITPRITVMQQRAWHCPQNYIMHVSRNFQEVGKQSQPPMLSLPSKCIHYIASIYAIWHWLCNLFSFALEFASYSELGVV